MVLKQGKRVWEAAQALGVSRRPAPKWLGRYKTGGWNALRNLSFRPQHSPRRMPVARVATIAAPRRMAMSSFSIAFYPSMPLATVTLELRRRGLNRLPRLLINR